MSGTSKRLRAILIGSTAATGVLATPAVTQASPYAESRSAQSCESGGGVVSQSFTDGTVACFVGVQAEACARQHGSLARYDPDRRACAVPQNQRSDSRREPAPGDPFGDCFVTTACVSWIGLKDDCFELRQLRRFRDGALAHMPGGQEDIRRYYAEAPAIVRGILASDDPSRELRSLYVRYIVPSAVAATFGLHRITRKIYTSMMRDLSRRYPSSPGSLGADDPAVSS